MYRNPICLLKFVAKTNGKCFGLLLRSVVFVWFAHFVNVAPRKSAIISYVCDYIFLFLFFEDFRNINCGCTRRLRILIFFFTTFCIHHRRRRRHIVIFFAVREQATTITSHTDFWYLICIIFIYKVNQHYKNFQISRFKQTEFIGLYMMSS